MFAKINSGERESQESEWCDAAWRKNRDRIVKSASWPESVLDDATLRPQRGRASSGTRTRTNRHSAARQRQCLAGNNVVRPPDNWATTDYREREIKRKELQSVTLSWGRR